MRRSIDNLITGLMLAVAISMATLVFVRFTGTHWHVPAPRQVTLPHWAEPEARKTVIVFTDLQCPGCGNVREFLAYLQARHDLQIVRRHFPLNGIHQHAFQAAMASECAGEQGWSAEYDSVLYDKQSLIGLKSWSSFAEQASMPDIGAFETCVVEERYRGKVQQDLSLAEMLGLNSVPSIVFDGRVFTIENMATLDDYLEGF